MIVKYCPPKIVETVQERELEPDKQVGFAANKLLKVVCSVEFMVTMLLAGRGLFPIEK